MNSRLPGAASAISRAGSVPPRKANRKRRLLGWVALGLVLLWAVAVIFNRYRPLPDGVSYSGAPRPADNVRFLADRTYVDDDGRRHTEQRIFDEIFRLIDQAERFVLLDMFLFNAYQGSLPQTHRPLSSELTDRLIARKRAVPELQILVISDPLNSLYGGLPSPHFRRLEAAGIPVTLTDLTELRDSNPLYAALWRPFIQPWGNEPAGTLPNPFGQGRVSLRSYLALLNFKANHRKLLIADHRDRLTALVTSANPHDGSSAHGNVALRFSGPAAWDLLHTERAVLQFSGGPAGTPDLPEADIEVPDNLTVQVVTEQAVEQAALALINGAAAGEHVDLAMFYLSDRDLIGALQDAAARGVKLRVLLDPNKDAFGREKNGVPNRPVAHELVEAGVSVRWCDTHGEQCHSKWLMHRGGDGQASMLLGSTNFTRRNLHNLNLETSVVLRGPMAAKPLSEGVRWFEERWFNRRERQYSLPYEAYADERLWPRLMYRAMEATGLSTF